ncbi:MAG: hypothetical protein PHE78_04745 [Candidatus Gastranaerophilales bacterium]|nr:hypothetical protein [Candidatus Gastranaerophilales bacterium]
MVVGNVNGGQNPGFVELVNKPQTPYGYQAASAAPLNGPAEDVYEGPKQEKKKGGFLKGLLITLGVAGALVGANRLAHSKGWLKPIEGEATSFVDKYIKKPLKSIDDFVVEKYNKIFKKGSKVEAPKGDGPDAPKGGSEAPEGGSEAPEA